MKPFSARYYLRNNKAKVTAIIFMISLISLIYVGGLYLMNISEEAYAIIDDMKDFVKVEETIDDTDYEQLIAFASVIEKEQEIESYHVGCNSFRYKTMLGFKNGSIAYAFEPEDFIRFNKKLHLVSEQEEYKNNTLFVTKREADFLNLKDGDTLITKDTEYIFNYFGKSPFDVKVCSGKSMNAFFVVDDVSNSSMYLLSFTDEKHKDVFYQRVEELRKTYNHLKFTTYQEEKNNTVDTFAINNVLYFSIIAIITIVFAITTNAVLVALYDKRRQELAVYQSIGIKNRKLYQKIISEILIMNGMGLLCGAAISVFVVSVLNEFVFSKDGLLMAYYHPTALKAVIICDLAIILPGIGLRLLKIAKDAKQPEYL